MVHPLLYQDRLRHSAALFEEHTQRNAQTSELDYSGATKQIDVMYIYDNPHSVEYDDDCRCVPFYVGSILHN